MCLIWINCCPSNVIAKNGVTWPVMNLKIYLTDYSWKGIHSLDYFLGNTKGDDDSQFTSKLTKCYDFFFLPNTMIFFAQLQFFKSITFCMIVLLYLPYRLSAHSMDFRIFCRLTARYQNLFICYCGLTYIVLLIMANLMITMQKNRKLYL